MYSRVILITVVLWLGLAPAAASAQGAAADAPGAYAGAHFGSLWKIFQYVEPDDPGFGFDGDAAGVVAGGLAGWNHRLRSSVVVGVEADLAAASVTFAADSAGGNEYSEVHLDLNAHVRARAGRAWGRTLVFVAGGLALARIGLDDVDPGWGEGHSMRRGWTIGAGFERAVGNRVRVRAEYLHDRYGLGHYDISAPPDATDTPFFPSYRADIDATSHTLRGAVVWRF